MYLHVVLYQSVYGPIITQSGCNPFVISFGIHYQKIACMMQSFRLYNEPR